MHLRKARRAAILNAISLGESAAGVYLEAWANATNDDELADCLRLVAARESSHGDVFCRRIAELGYTLEPKRNSEAAARLAKFADPSICRRYHSASVSFSNSSGVNFSAPSGKWPQKMTM